MKRVVVVGAGVGGLTAAAELARAGLQVTVLEAHVYPGGSAGTFYHQGYRFDAGATLAGGFAAGAPMDLIARRFDISWGAVPAAEAMRVHLPLEVNITRWADPERWRSERRAVFGWGAEPFWAWQESTAEALWDLASRLPPWPPQSITDLSLLADIGAGWLAHRRRAGDGVRLPAMFFDAFQPAASRLEGASERLRLFVDAQLLISAQTVSRRANALYAAAALDLPRRGVVHLPGGMGNVAENLARAVRRFGGNVVYRREVERLVFEGGLPVAVETRQGGAYPADLVLFNLPPWNVRRLLGEDAPRRLRRLGARPSAGWGAFTVYVGLDGRAVPRDHPLHHQVVARQPLGEGNSVFLSLNPEWDSTRAPQDRRALTISTHTGLAPWWRLFEQDREAYERRKQDYQGKLLQAAEKALPGLREALELAMPGTPVTFRRFTRRAWGWVGGFPQTSLWRTLGPRLRPDIWLVGDSVFPGQSVPAVALGGLRTAGAILRELGLGERPPTEASRRGARTGWKTSPFVGD